MHLPKSPAASPQDHCLALAAFIREKTDAIILRWSAVPYAGPGMSGSAALLRLRTEAAGLLDAIAEYVEGGEQRLNQPGRELISLNVCAERYAISHLTNGLAELQLVLMLQALRKAVLQLWPETMSESDGQALAAVLRMDQAFDNAMSAAVDHYCTIRDRCHGIFMKKLAHDLRNPLGGIELAAQMMLQDGAQAPGDMRKIASSISRSAAHAARLAGDLYDIGSMREGLGISVNPVALDAAALCGKLLDELLSHYPGQTVLLETGGPLTGVFDETRIAQAFANIIGYAFRHTAKTDPVTVKLQAASGALVFSVRYFSAIPALDDAEAMFAPMRRYASHVLSKKGPIAELGIDLFIAREIVLAHGGEIKAIIDQEWMTFEVCLQLDGRCMP